ncbi:flagellar basal-body rod protein FlgF [Desulfoplanes sp.]
MQSAVYSAVFGGTTQAKSLDLIANNLANVNTTGYKKDALSFCNVFEQQAMGGDVEVSKTRIGAVDIDMSQGGLRKTDNPLDFGLDGEGFFKVRTPEGIQYTRNGIFRLDPDGTIVDPHGNPLQGQNGELRVPRGADLVVNGAGQILVDGAPMGRIDVVTFDDLQGLERIGQHLFRRPDGAPLKELEATDAQVCQGFLEASNVNVVQEMVRMIGVSRNFGAEQKIMTTSSGMDKKVIDTVGKV